MGTVRTALTMEEFFDLPEIAAGKREMLWGELIELPPANRRHNRIIHLIYEALKETRTGSRNAGEAWIEMGYKVSPRHWLQPDVSLTHSGQPGEDYLEGSPLLAIEVISDSNRASEIDAKIEAYLTYGAAEVWIVYPTRRHMWVYRPGMTAECHTGAYASPLFGGQIIGIDRILE